MRSILWVGLSSGLFVATACGVADLPPATSADDLTGPTTTDTACIRAPDLSSDEVAKLAKCECKSGGSARCVPAKSLPARMTSQLDACDSGSGACVPDSILSLGDHSLPACKRDGADGRCLSLCVPLVAKYGSSVLTRGDGNACANDERCVPCTNPLDATSTGICDVGTPASSTCTAADAGAPSHAAATSTSSPSKTAGSTTAAPATPATAGKSCCPIDGTARGTCTPSADVPDDLRDHVSAHECKGGELCVPDDSSGTVCGFGAGTCFSKCTDFGPFTDTLPDPGSCQSDEQCVPLLLQ